jgi:hypothetical protein
MGGVPFWSNPSTVDGFGGEGTGTGPAGQVYAEDAILGDGSKIGSAWDTVKFAGIRLPGVCEVKGVAALQVDNKKPKQADGSTISITGYMPGPFEVTCMVWTDTQWDVLQKAIDVLWETPTKKSKLASVAVDVSHPGLQTLRIKSCAIVSVSLPEPGREVGTKLVRFKCIENTPPKKKKAKTAKGSAVGRVASYASGEAPLNFSPAKPSENKANMSPAGQPFTPAGGSY